MGNGVSIAEAGRKQGNALFTAGDLAGAVRLYKKSLEAGATDRHLLYSNLSACYLAAGLLDAALTAANAAVDESPSWPKGHFRRGAALAELALWPEATLSLQRALAGEPQSATVQALLARCLERAPPVAIRGQSMVHSWGRGEFGALGHGDLKDKPTPRAIDALRGMLVADIACGTGHTLVASEAGDVFAWGWNSKGQCGLPDAAEAVCVPTMLGSLMGRGVRAVACGAAHSLAVTAQGEVCPRPLLSGWARRISSVTRSTMHLLDRCSRGVSLAPGSWGTATQSRAGCRV